MRGFPADTGTFKLVTVAIGCDELYSLLVEISSELIVCLGGYGLFSQFEFAKSFLHQPCALCQFRLAKSQKAPSGTY